MTRRTIPLLAAAAALTAALALSPTTAGGQTATCDQPYSPVAFSGSSASQPPSGEIPELDVTEVSGRIQVDQDFDSDGDGVVDTVAQEPGVGVRITRGDGDVLLTSTGGVDRPYRVGDIDGDGRDEFAVPESGGSNTVLVPGTVPTGTTPLYDAGIRMANGTFGLTYLDDGSGRLIDHIEPTVSVTEARTEVYDAAAVLALGPGATFETTTLAPELTIAARITTLGDLGGQFVLLGGRAFADPDEPDRRIELVVVDGTDVVELTTSPERYQGDYVEQFGPITLLDGPDGTFVLLNQSSRDGGARYLWSLDDPCTSLVDPTDPPTTAPVPPPAPPARPVPADARFTG